MKMYFYYGAMGSSKTANALMTRFSWEDKGKKVALLKPSIDNRDGVDIVKSRAGLMAKANLVFPEGTIQDALDAPAEEYDNIIVDEAQFLTKAPFLTITLPERTLFITVPSILQPSAMYELTTFASLPCFVGGRSRFLV